MLVICNGAFKSGSTWVYELVSSILKVKGISLSDVPLEYSPNKSPAMKIAESKLADFVTKEPIDQKNYLTKAHFFNEETLKADYPKAVKFLFVERDLRDAVVSHYHHFLIYKKTSINFKKYYKLVGRYKAYEIWLFNKRCEKYFGRDAFFQFEDMKVNVSASIDKICRLLDIPVLSPNEKEQVINETSLDSLRKRAKGGDNTHYHGAGVDNSKLFRKGKTGEYQDYFDKKDLRDIENIISGDFPSFSRFIYNVLFTYRRKIL